MEPEMAARDAVSVRSVGGVSVAPIGAHVFLFERRNHYKTGVYKDLCVPVSVDTSIAVDKLKRSKRASNSRGSTFSQRLERSRGGRVSANRTGREARKMGGLSFALASRIGLCGSPRVATLRSRPWSAEPFGISTFLRRPVGGSETRFQTEVRTPQSGGKLAAKLPQTRTGKSECALFDPQGGCAFRADPHRVRHRPCTMNRPRVGTESRLRKKLRGGAMRRRRNERT